MKKILLIGCGYWGKNWYNTIKNSDYELVAVVDSNPIISINDVPLYNQLEDIDIEFTHAIIATPVKYHFDTFTFLVDKGIKPENILVEKPCGLNSEHASLMQDAYPGFIFLHDPVYQYIKNNIDNLGNILSFNSVRASMGPRIRTDVSIVADYLIHDLYIFADLFGVDFLSNITVNMNRYFKHPIKCDTIDLQFHKNINHIDARMFSSWWWPQKERKIVIIGTKGSFVWENDELRTINEYYKSISGTDDVGNVGYKLVQDSTKWHYRNATFTSKLNLELELEAFIENKKPFSDNLMMDVWKFMESI